MSARRAGAASLGLLVAAALGACGTAVEGLTLQLTDSAGTCSSGILSQIDALVVELRGPAGPSASCRAVKDVEIQTLAGLQAELARGYRFVDLEEGDYRLKVRGYDDGCPDPNELLVCGHRELPLPADGATLTLVVICYDGSSPPAAFSSCEAW